mmetsp:Transcript_56457/g.182868  ORF Transcript_56457/g.182868 Transcript_56457/m.182868 type:complete len:494 (+) Transcript_56457:373-1854(+)
MSKPRPSRSQRQFPSPPRQSPPPAPLPTRSPRRPALAGQPGPRRCRRCLRRADQRHGAAAAAAGLQANTAVGIQVFQHSRMAPAAADIQDRRANRSHPCHPANQSSRSPGAGSADRVPARTPSSGRRPLQRMASRGAHRLARRSPRHHAQARAAGRRGAEGRRPFWRSPCPHRQQPLRPLHGTGCCPTLRVDRHTSRRCGSTSGARRPSTCRTRCPPRRACPGCAAGRCPGRARERPRAPPARAGHRLRPCPAHLPQANLHPSSGVWIPCRVFFFSSSSACLRPGQQHPPRKPPCRRSRLAAPAPPPPAPRRRLRRPRLQPRLLAVGAFFVGECRHPSLRHHASFASSTCAEQHCPRQVQHHWRLQAPHPPRPRFRCPPRRQRPAAPRARPPDPRPPQMRRSRRRRPGPRRRRRRHRRPCAAVASDGVRATRPCPLSSGVSSFGQRRHHHHRRHQHCRGCCRRRCGRRRWGCGHRGSSGLCCPRRPTAPAAAA